MHPSAKNTSPMLVGLRFAGLWAAITLVLAIIVRITLGYSFVRDYSVGFLLGVLVMLPLAFIAGFTAARQTHRVRDGLLAGLFIGIVSGAAYMPIMYFAGIVVVLVRFHELYLPRIGYFDPYYVLFMLIATIVEAAIMLGVGAIGGAVGRGPQAPRQPQVIYAYPVPQLPVAYPGYPAYPAQQPQGAYPGYPPQPYPQQSPQPMPPTPYGSYPYPPQQPPAGAYPAYPGYPAQPPNTVYPAYSTQPYPSQQPPAPAQPSGESQAP